MLAMPPSDFHSSTLWLLAYTTFTMIIAVNATVVTVTGDVRPQVMSVLTRPWNQSSRTNRLDSTENRSINSTLVDSVDRLDSAENRWIPSTRFPLFILALRIFSWAKCFSSSCLFACHNHGLCSWLLDNSQTCRLTRSPDPCAKTTGRIELQFGVLIGLGQCHFVLDGCPIPNRPSATFSGEGHSLSLDILLPYILQTAQVEAWSK